jgi:ABC-type antimicrobial peptide transport system permease subunit
MSTAQIIQLIITLFGIALAVVVFLFGPFEMLWNGLIAFLVFIVTGLAASFAYARLATQTEKIRDLRDRVDNPPT